MWGKNKKPYQNNKFKIHETKWGEDTEVAYIHIEH